MTVFLAVSIPQPHTFVNITKINICDAISPLIFKINHTLLFTYLAFYGTILRQHRAIRG